MDTFLNDYLHDPYIGKIAAILIGIIIINIIIHFLQRLSAVHPHTRDVKYRIRRILKFIGYFASVFLVIGVFSNQFSSITIALGVAGAGIAFALQEVIVSIAGWLALSFGQFYTIGDRVQLGGIQGDVIDIGVLRTTIMEMGQWVHGDQYNGRIVRVANSFVFKEPVYNYSADFPFVWDEIKLPVKYGSDHHLARKLLLDTAHDVVGDFVEIAREKWKETTRKYAIENAIVEPMVFLVANDNWMEFTLRYVVDYSKRRSTVDALYTRLLDAIAKTDGKVAIASSTLQLVDSPRTQPATAQ